MNDNDSKNFIWYIKKYKGAVIGGIIAIVFVATGLTKFLMSLLVIIFGIFVGYYIQNNKDEVKQKLKEFIDKV